ncbi:hypothetical protein SDC9_180603 [bioreactor metagenome]|uniref:Uncharacterized protein n=1 Tax=bioreactor metagenome TaxID=1076179 RepID=A0A645H344_9ZZZZ
MFTPSILQAFHILNRSNSLDQGVAHQPCKGNIVHDHWNGNTFGDVLIIVEYIITIELKVEGGY